jgi:hypothetical protein
MRREEAERRVKSKEEPARALESPAQEVSQENATDETPAANQSDGGGEAQIIGTTDDETPAADQGDVTKTDPGLSENRLKQMNKDKLIEYGTSLGLNLSPDLKKDEMIEAIQKRETELGG